MEVLVDSISRDHDSFNIGRHCLHYCEQETKTTT